MRSKVRRPKYVRYYAHFQGTETSAEFGDVWMAMVMDLTSQGMQLQVGRPFYVGKRLWIEIPCGTEKNPGQVQTVMVTVAHAERNDEHWIIGCRYTSSVLSASEQALKPVDEPGSKRRQSSRHSCQLSGICAPLLNTSNKTWGGNIDNLSAEGLGLRLPRRFEPSSLLSISVHRPERDHFLLGKVVHVRADTEGHWNLGCLLCNPLDEETMKVILAKA